MRLVNYKQFVSKSERSLSECIWNEMHSNMNSSWAKASGSRASNKNHPSKSLHAFNIGVLTVDHFRWVVDNRRVRVAHIFGVLYSCQPLSCDQFHCLPIGPFLNASLSIYVHRCCDEPMRIVCIKIFQYCMMPIPHLAIAQIDCDLFICILL